MSTDSEFYQGLASSGASHEIMLQQAARMAGLGYFVFNIDALIVEICSESHAAIFGHTPASFIERATGITGAMSMIHPDDVQILRNAYARVKAGETVNMEYRFRHADGSSGVVREIVAPDKNSAGRVIRGIGSSMDVTRAHEDARQRAEALRLEALGAVTAGVAHDFNNIFAAVMGNAELAAALGAGAGTDAATCLEEIVAAASRGGALTRKLLSFAQRARIAPRVVPLDRVAREAATDFAHKAPNALDIRFQTDVNDLHARIDADGLKTILSNVLQNAQEAISDAGRVVISTHMVDDGEARRLKSEHALTSDTFSEIRIGDTGSGIAPADLHRVTEPFFTTRNRAAQSGLGLSMATGFARQSGGALEIRSTEGAGTDVRLFFPVYPDRRKSGRLTGLAPRDTVRTVALLEDDQSLGKRLCAQLEAGGYTVIPATSVQALLDVVHHQAVDIVLIDMVISDLKTGHELAEMIKAQNPRVATILYSGVTQTKPSIRPPGVDAILPNPTTMDDLLNAVARVSKGLPVRHDNATI